MPLQLYKHVKAFSQVCSYTRGQITVLPIHGKIQLLRISKHSKSTGVNLKPLKSLAEGEP